MRSRFFSFTHVLIGKPVPTFPGHALPLRMSLSENRFPLFRDMRCLCACPYRKTGSHFSGTCVMHAFSTEMIRIGACADGNTGDRGIAAPHPQYLPGGRNCARRRRVGPRGIPARRRAGRKGRSMTMTNAEYFRRQAATCVRLAKFCRDLEVARGLFGMAQEFKAKAAELDTDLQAMPLRALGQSSDAACGSTTPPDTIDSATASLWSRPRPPPSGRAGLRRGLGAQFGLVAGRPASRRRQGGGADYHFGAGVSPRCGLHATSPPFHNWAILKGGLPGGMRPWG